MKVLLHSHFPAGHALPMQAVAQALTSRGHAVVWLTSRDNEARVAFTGAQFAATQAVAAVDAPLARDHSSGVFPTAYKHLDARLLAQVSDYREVLARFAPDLVLVDVFPHGARALYDLGEGPVFATLGVIPMYTSHLRAPLPSSGMCPPARCLARVQNALRQLLNRWLWQPLHLAPDLNAQRARLGLAPLPPREAPEWFAYSPHLHIQASCPSLEFNQLPCSPAHEKHTTFVGPLVTRTDADPSKLPGWWAELPTTRQIVGITQGTLAMDPASLIVPSIRALKDHEQLILVVVSPYVQDIQARVGSCPNVRYAAWLPYGLLLPRLSLLITNGGYGSVTQALSHGVPLLCAGQSEDKRDTAARVTFSGAGVDLRTDNPSAESVRAAACAILGDEAYKARARRVGDELNRLGGADAACDALEDLVRSTKI
ncbi:uncharacterized protein UV8b_07198 [Ustilaginoidea virens]|uniref:Erythromycin biosynthesis protein CIII-like C-terminal domain-containing protein n=1 Tax=Ustilaginoidea virens TaxID=1159556 RepID=A0A063BXP7_USTVR|nr:uncharacterized protein UV8b_07198 [Ustilaginoidea virens]QUC22957.1 hypothetical protein UV8b_07198 [Ustilaginoidea virens]GAO20095.1 hypothetical protein UVI_02042560 [Ustilaginoidea virens]